MMQGPRESRKEETGAAGTGGGAFWRALASAMLLLLLGARIAAAGPEIGYRFGVFPYVPALAIDEIFGPLTARLSRDLGIPIHLKTKSTFEDFADELAQETYEIILVHPFFYVDAADRHNYLPLARVDADLTAVVLVPEDRSGDGWADLADATLALPPALSAVSEVVQAALREHDLVPGRDVTLRHYATKMSCLHAVAFGEADGCALPDFILAQLGALAEMRLRVMARTAPIRHFALAVHERMAAADRAMLLQCLLALPNTEEGRAILAATAWPRFVAAQDGDYEEVRRFRNRKRTLAQR